MNFPWFSFTLAPTLAWFGYLLFGQDDAKGWAIAGAIGMFGVLYVYWIANQIEKPREQQMRIFQALAATWEAQRKWLIRPVVDAPFNFVRWMRGRQ